MSMAPDAGTSPFQEPQDPPPPNFSEFDYEDDRPTKSPSAALWLNARRYDIASGGTVDPNQIGVQSFQLWAQHPEGTGWEKYTVQAEGFLTACTFTFAADGTASAKDPGTGTPFHVQAGGTYPNPPWQ